MAKTTGPMQPATSMSSTGHHWLEQAKSRHLSEPGRHAVLAHGGRAVHGTTAALVREAEAFSQAMDDPISLRKRLINVMLEAVDNVGKHALGIQGDATYVLLLRDAQGYLLTTGNAVPMATATLLEHRMALLNGMDREDLREHYLKVLANSSRSDHGGAGLGLLTLARRCTRPIGLASEVLGPYTAYLQFNYRVDLAEEPGAEA
jgi:hypothetical protein